MEGPNAYIINDKDDDDDYDDNSQGRAKYNVNGEENENLVKEEKGEREEENN